jgi:hypothetical protein
VLWALAAAARQRWGALAAALAVGFAVKQTTLLFVPLALALALLRLPARATPRTALAAWWAATRRVLPALALTTLFIFAWDAARQYSIGFWSQGYADNMPGRLVRANELVPRARAWLDLLHYATASRPLNVIAVAGIAGLLLTAAHSRRAPLADGLLAAFVAAYLGAYWLLAFNVWDRYLLPLLPLVFLLVARGLLWLGRLGADAIARTSLQKAPPSLPGKACPPGGRSTPSRASGRREAEGRARGLGPRATRAGELGYPALLVAVALALLPGSFAATRSAYPIGGDHGAYDGVDDAARYLANLPAGTVLYDHWLSWQWNYYLYDAPVYVAWMPTPEAFAADLAAFGTTSPRYLAVPSWEQDAELRAAGVAAGYDFVPRHTSFRRDGSLSLTIYELVPQRAAHAHP